MCIALYCVRTFIRAVYLIEVDHFLFKVFVGHSKLDGWNIFLIGFNLILKDGSLGIAIHVGHGASLILGIGNGVTDLRSDPLELTILGDGFDCI